MKAGLLWGSDECPHFLSQSFFLEPLGERLLSAFLEKKKFLVDLCSFF